MHIYTLTCALKHTYTNTHTRTLRSGFSIEMPLTSLLPPTAAFFAAGPRALLAVREGASSCVFVIIFIVYSNKRLVLIQCSWRLIICDNVFMRVLYAGGKGW
jgi:hypothetical protein